MSNRKRQVPEAVHKKLASLGIVGQAWLDGLDTLVHALERDWHIRVGNALAGGSEAFVAEAVDGHGSPVVLKVAIPPMPGNTWLENEVAALKLVDGHGYVRLLAYDPGRRALLLERLGNALGSLGLPTERQIEILCETLRATWIPVPPHTPPLTETDVFAEFPHLLETLYANAAPGIGEALVRQALRACEARAAAFDPQTAMLVHGDAHNANLLQVLSPADQAECRFKFIDPDGIVCHPAYDLSVLMREWVDELLDDPVRLGRERCAYLSRLTGVDTEEIWDWGLIQCVATGLLLTQVGQEHEGMKLLRVADAWVDHLA
ncbi:MAG: aminoglycoside phosphotransferase family protein [Anaerolineae bacterium]